MSVVNVEFAGLGLFFTLGKITPRLRVAILWLDVGVIGVVTTTGRMLDGGAIEETVVVEVTGGVDVVTKVGIGVSFASSSGTATYLRSGNG